MDPLSTTVGFLGLAGLLSNCIEYFELVQAGRHHSVDYEIILRKFQAQRARLITWGMVTGIIGARDYDTSLDETHIYTAVRGLLNVIKLLFENGDNLVHKYGLRRANSEAESSDSHNAVLRETFESFQQRLSQNQSHTSFIAKTRWAIVDRNKFRQLVADITEAVDAIQDLTESVGALTRQNEVVHEQINRARTQGNSNDVRVLQEAASETAIVQNRSQHVTERSGDSIGVATSQTAMQDDDLARQVAAMNLTAPNASASVATRSAHTQDEPVSQTRRQISPSRSDMTVLEIPVEVTAQVNRTRLDRFISGPNHDLAVLQSRDEKMAELVSEDHVTTMDDVPPTGNQNQARRILMEFRRHFERSDLSYISVSCINGSLRDLLGIVRGPPDSPYHGGIFFVRMYLTDDYPMGPIIIQFLTKVYHPNIDEQGRVCIFSGCWSPALGFETVLISLSALLSLPIPEEPLRPNVAAQFLRDRENFNRIAKAYTTLYARGERPRVDPPTVDNFWWDYAQVDEVQDTEPVASQEETQPAESGET